MGGCDDDGVPRSPILHAGLTLDILQRGQIPGTEEICICSVANFTLRSEPERSRDTGSGRGRRRCGDGEKCSPPGTGRSALWGTHRWPAPPRFGDRHRPRHVFLPRPAFSRAAGGRNSGTKSLHDRRTAHQAGCSHSDPRRKNLTPLGASEQRDTVPRCMRNIP